jgi:hypothetical protein
MPARTTQRHRFTFPDNTQDKRRLRRPLHPLVLSRVAYFGQIA